MVTGDIGKIVPIRNPHAIAEAIDFFKTRDVVGLAGDNAWYKAKANQWDVIRSGYADLFSSLQKGR